MKCAFEDPKKFSHVRDLEKSVISQTPNFFQIAVSWETSFCIWSVLYFLRRQGFFLLFFNWHPWPKSLIK